MSMAKEMVREQWHQEEFQYLSEFIGNVFTRGMHLLVAIQGVVGGGVEPRRAADASRCSHRFVAPRWQVTPA